MSNWANYIFLYIHELRMSFTKFYYPGERNTKKNGVYNLKLKPNSVNKDTVEMTEK